MSKKKWVVAVALFAALLGGCVSSGGYSGGGSISGASGGHSHGIFPTITERRSPLADEVPCVVRRNAEAHATAKPAACCSAPLPGIHQDTSK
jgi:hypothetical protein